MSDPRQELLEAQRHQDHMLEDFWRWAEQRPSASPIKFNFNEIPNPLEMVSAFNQVLEAGRQDLGRRLPEVPEHYTAALDTALTATPLGLTALPRQLASTLARTTKVIDPQTGMPQRVLHGTPRTYDQPDARYFDPDAMYGPGFYATEGGPLRGGVEQVTAGYAVHPRYGVEGAAPQVRTQYLDIRRPFNIDDPLSAADFNDVMAATYESYPKWAHKIAQPLEIIGRIRPIIGKDVYDYLRIMTAKPRYNDSGMFLGRDHAAVNQVLERAGFDGITHIGGKVTDGDLHRVWVAFRPEQVIAGEQGLVELANRALRQGEISPAEYLEIIGREP